jgi:hypothetical protein
MILIVLRRPKKWTKTDKQGKLALSTVLEQATVNGQLK